MTERLSSNGDDGSHSASNQDPKGALSLFQPRPQSCPKLGDFASLRSATIDFKPQHHILSRQVPSDGGTRLGDLSRVVNQLRALESRTEKGIDASPSFSKTASELRLNETCPQLSPTSHPEQTISVKIEKSVATIATRAKSPGSATKSRLGLGKAPFGRSLSASESGASRPGPLQNKGSSSKLSRVLAYEFSEKALVIPVFDTARTVEQAHESLTANLIPYCTADRHLALKYPSNETHGVHVFLDMSNIEISFQKALRKRYGIAESARFSTLPRLNLRFLTEILLRGRSSRGLHVGCSILPGKREPRYVQELRDLGYHVDVRERKRVDAGAGAGLPANASSWTGSKTTISRYVEELVDETIQTRMAEAVMEFFQEQGTIVLATGDAKPAQYSDGFFRYVERALRMGWNVELVAWHGSLSSSWRDTDWTSQWGGRFRVIELDSFIYDLLEIQI